MTIHLCSKELVDVSKMFRKISLKNTCMMGGQKRIVIFDFAFSFLIVFGPHLSVAQGLLCTQGLQLEVLRVLYRMPLNQPRPMQECYPLYYCSGPKTWSLNRAQTLKLPDRQIL